MIPVVGTVIALMPVAVIVIVISVRECENGRQGKKQRGCKQSFLHGNLYAKVPFLGCAAPYTAKHHAGGAMNTG